MKRSKGFILAEILTGMLLQAGFILVLCASFYLLVSFSSGTQQILTAREKGQRVIAYVDSRIRNAGLGLWKLEKSSEYRTAFSKFTTSPKPLSLNNSQKLTLPVAITYKDSDALDNQIMSQAATKTYNKTVGTETHETYYGNILTLLYAQRETEKNINFLVFNDIETSNVTTKVDENNPIGINEELLMNDTFAREFLTEVYGKKSKELEDYNDMRGWILWPRPSVSMALFRTLTGRGYWGAGLDILFHYRQFLNEIKPIREQIYQWASNNPKYNDKEILNELVTESCFNFLTDGNELEGTRFSDGNANQQDIRSYGVMIGTGQPILVREYSDSDNELILSPDITIKDGDELLYLKCERMLAAFDNKDVRNFKIQELENSWGNINPHEKDILEIYMELDKETNIFTLWVLASGGTDGRTHKRPSAWPDNARPIKTSSKDNWDTSDYRFHVVYVSKASWKLNNVNFESAADWD